MKRLFHILQPEAVALCRGYAAVLCSGKAWVGLLLFGATMLLPWHGLTGLAGMIIALVVARMAGFDRVAVNDGRLLFNSLLCSLALAYWIEPGSGSFVLYVALLVFVSITALGATVALNHITYNLAGAGSLSLPFCFVATGLHWLVNQQGLSENLVLNPIPFDDLPSWLSGMDSWNHAMGAVFFMPMAAVGLVVTAILLLNSRLSVLFAAAGFGVAAGLLHSLGVLPAQSAWPQMNALFCAVALGGVFFIPSRGSLALALLGAAICTLGGCALLHVLTFLDAPLLTWPFNFAVLGFIAALRWRAPGREPFATIVHGSSPEVSFRAAELWAARNAAAALPAISAPFDGEWVVTQGFASEPTHRGLWQFALDFEVAGAAHRAAHPNSALLEDFPSFGAPVVAPADGRVVRLEDNIADNAIGENNLSENWGNSIVIETAPGLYVQLSHFRRRGFKVREGDRVRQGQLLGYLGNSGRSPVPHLHLQMQTQPDIGATTIPFRLCGYRTPAENGQWTYHFRNLPAQDTALAGCRRARWMEDNFSAESPVDRVYRVFTGRGENRETIRQTLDLDGSLLLQSLEKRGRLRLVVADGWVTPTEYHGPRGSLLMALWAGGRIPLVAAPDLQWEEPANPTAHLSAWQRLGGDLIAPFLRRAPGVLQGTLAACDPGTKQFTVRWMQPERYTVELSFAAERGLVSGRLETAHGWMRFLARETAALALPQTPVRTPAHAATAAA
jgi:murein DD-endopeptidase MepM/ murein hydrolase activator NlpD/urea transporter